MWLWMVSILCLIGSVPVFADASRDELIARQMDCVDQAWRAQTVTAFSATAQVSQLARDYREQTPIKHMYICQAGKDY